MQAKHEWEFVLFDDSREAKGKLNRTQNIKKNVFSAKNTFDNIGTHKLKCKWNAWTGKKGTSSSEMYQMILIGGRWSSESVWV